VSLRISSLDYLGVVAARLRRDAVQSRLKIDTINAIIETVKEAEEEAGETVEEDSDLEEEEQRTRFLQRVLLDYLAVNGGEVRQKCVFMVANVWIGEKGKTKFPIYHQIIGLQPVHHLVFILRREKLLKPFARSSALRWGGLGGSVTASHSRGCVMSVEEVFPIHQYHSARHASKQ
jgi:hypothetical protein